ncbi:MAG: nitrilase-related carbon-nitrogen hydrolase [Pirellulaceae bacterium]
MNTIRVAAVSMNSPLGEQSRMLDAIDGWCRKAADAGAELVLFPELLLHGHCAPNTWELAEEVPDGPSVARLSAIAREYRLTLSVGLSEKQRDIVYNTQVLVGPDGYIGKQRKLHPSRDEVLYYKGGRELPVFDIGKCKVGMIICYDNQFPEPARILALRGADVLLMPHAARMRMWDDSPGSAAAARQYAHEHFQSCYAMRARENACYVVLADQAGRAGYVDTYPANSPYQPHHAGAALVFAPNGDLLASTQEEEIRDEMILAELTADQLAQERALPNYTLRTRRPELYGELVREQVDW